MYESKRKGRNRVSVAKPIGETSWQEVAIDTFIDILSKHRIPIDKKTSGLLSKKLQQMNINNDVLYQVSDALVSTYNPEHERGGTKKKVILATLLAKRFDLYESGGSDFHGTNKPDIQLGIGRGNLEIPYEFLENLKNAKHSECKIDKPNIS